MNSMLFLALLLSILTLSNASVPIYIGREGTGVPTTTIPSFNAGFGTVAYLRFTLDGPHTLKTMTAVFDSLPCDRYSYDLGIYTLTDWNTKTYTTEHYSVTFISYNTNELP